MQGDFELNKIGWYTPILVDENQFINDKNSPQDLAKYGKTYSVVFEGDATTYLWTAKTEPVKGQRYWGHLQPTSGSSIRFKTDKQEETIQVHTPATNAPTGSYVAQEAKEDSIARAVALKAAVQFCVELEQGSTPDQAIDVADVFLAWLQGNYSGVQAGGTASGAAVNAPNEPDKPQAAAAPKRDWSKVGQHEEPLPEEPGDLLNSIGEQPDEN